MDKPIVSGETICNIEKEDIEKLKSLSAELAMIDKQRQELVAAKYNFELRNITIWAEIRRKYLLDLGNYEVNFVNNQLIRK